MHSKLFRRWFHRTGFLLQWYVVSVIVTMIPTSLLAKEVSISHQGRTLNGELSIRADGASSKPMVLLVHGALGHRNMETIRYLSTLLVENGVNTLAINLSLGLDDRKGMYDCAIPHTHTNEDAVSEIHAWRQWLEQQKFSKIVLLGHSRGGAQVALYNTLYPSDSVVAAVLMAPATDRNTNAQAYQARYQQALAPLIEKAQQLLTQKDPAPRLKNIGLMTCGNTTATAKSFLSYYGPQSQVDTLVLLPKSQIPVLVIVAGADRLVVKLDQRLHSIIDDTQRLRMKVIEGSDHMFRDLNSDEAVEAITQFLDAVL